jgi:hypothetical protein
VDEVRRKGKKKNEPKKREKKMGRKKKKYRGGNRKINMTHTHQRVERRGEDV